MAFHISDIRTTSPKNGCKYLFDANVWLAVLYDFYNEPYYSPYTKFFNEIIRNKTAPTAIIVVPSLLLSEIINRVMNDIYYWNYCKYSPKSENQKKSDHFKKSYRKDPIYISDLKEICDFITDYSDKITFTSDYLEEYTCDTFLKGIPTHLDFNDYVMAKLSAKENFIIVTNDSDFKVENVKVLTTQKSLLDLMG